MRSGERFRLGADVPFRRPADTIDTFDVHSACGTFPITRSTGVSGQESHGQELGVRWAEIDLANERGENIATCLVNGLGASEVQPRAAKITRQKSGYLDSGVQVPGRN